VRSIWAIKQDHEARIIKLETQVQSLSQQLTLEIAALKVWFSEKLDFKLEEWRKENDHKLEEWRQGLDRKLDGLRGDMDKKFMWMIGLVVALMVGLYFR